PPHPLSRGGPPPAGGPRPPPAMPSAPVTSSAVRSARIDQPTHAREQPSTSAATYSTPSPVGSSVKSPIHSASGLAAVKLRLTRSAAAVALGSRRVPWCLRRQ